MYSSEVSCALWILTINKLLVLQSHKPISAELLQGIKPPSLTPRQAAPAQSAPQQQQPPPLPRPPVAPAPGQHAQQPLQPAAQIVNPQARAPAVLSAGPAAQTPAQRPVITIVPHHPTSSAAPSPSPSPAVLHHLLVSSTVSHKSLEKLCRGYLQTP
jgi:hypothetical protein